MKDDMEGILYEKCPECGKKFKCEHTLQQHKNKYHPFKPKVADCKFLDNTPPKCYPTGYEGCKFTGKICIPKAYNNTDCLQYSPV